MVLAAILTNKPNLNNSVFENGIEVKEFDLPEPQPDQSIVKIQAAAFNHRDIWITKGLYADIIHNSVLGADAVGIVKKKGTASVDEGQRVLINPGVNWDSDPRRPEGEFRILGLLPSPGTFAESIVVDSKEVFPCPEHLSTSEAAALPLAGLTAYRATFSKCQVQKGDYVLITGIGGGVALFALQFAVAVGAHVYVTSSNPEKIKFAKELGAEGGINYKDSDAIEELNRQLNGNKIDAVIDGSSGDLFNKLPKVLRAGAIIAQYGDTARIGGVNYNIHYWLNNIELKGSTMGSRDEFGKMVDFVDKYKIKPVVSHSFKGLTQENVEKSVSLLTQGQQLGKVVIEV
ncbi:Zn-dependent oxidoreductase [Phascolomyces articulosus]|uniref:Zn-dependent oxidoreductase n=1 Tax=Phascolomyces articulosus TaxID=60185 RepID=A0AAD5KRQ4_9FUNG|nr:Zn-dependent oxidoreductase [Phascolomyces articulosus]